MAAARKDAACGEDVSSEECGMGVLLELRGVTKSYNGWSKALDSASLTVRRGEFVSVIGPSGSGKSTLLRCVNRLIEPTQGSVRFNGQEMCGLRGRELRACRRRISMVFQHYNLVYRATSIENVLQGRLGYKSTIAGALGLFSEDEKRRAFETLDQVGLSAFAYTRVDQLSGGQKQRVGIARALVQDPLLLLADEPVASLDPKSARTVMEHLRWAADELGVACLVNLHQVDFALEFSDRIVGLKAGRMVYDGAPDGLDQKMIADLYATDAPDASDASDGADGAWERGQQSDDGALAGRRGHAQCAFADSAEAAGAVSASVAPSGAELGGPVPALVSGCREVAA